LDTVATGLHIPWGLAFLPDGDVIITDRKGPVYRQRKGEEKKEIKGTPEVKFTGQGGMMDVELHPDFANNQVIYLSYSKPKGEEESTTAVMMARLVNDELVDQKIILEALPYYSTGYHYGSRLEFDDQGYLFISIGDRGKRDIMPQDLAFPGGKIHRINADGSIPKDNPFVNTPGALPSIWSYGHRNPQGLIYDKENGILWETEHAPRGGDELNIITKGTNYGWPLISYGIEYSGGRFTDLTEQEGMEQPIFYYLPSTGTCGLTLVTSDRYPKWKGDLLAGSLRFQYVSRLKMENNQVVGEERLLDNIGRLRTVNEGPDGYIYISVEDPGYVFRLVPM
jgi:glucose/arabinose dehydrogenase